MPRRTPGLTDVFRGLTFVGMASPQSMLAQGGTRLYLMHLPKLLTDLAYQRVRAWARGLEQGSGTLARGATAVQPCWSPGTGRD